MEAAQAPSVGQTIYIITGAGSNIRDNAIKVPESLYLIEDNGFTVHSANTTHTQITLVKFGASHPPLVSCNCSGAFLLALFRHASPLSPPHPAHTPDGTVVYTKVQPVMPKLRDDPTKARPVIAPVNWMDPTF